MKEPLETTDIPAGPQPDPFTVIPPPVAPPPPPPAVNGEFLYFQKIFTSQPFYINRNPVAFEQLAESIGVLKIAAADPNAAILTQTAKLKRGGILCITEEQFLELKKKLPFNPLGLRSAQPKLRVLPVNLFHKPKDVVAEVVAAGKKNDEREIIREGISGRPSGVGPVGGYGTGGRAGTPPPVPSSPEPPPGEFQPAVAPKNFKMPVIKKTDSKSFEGGTFEKEPTG